MVPHASFDPLGIAVFNRTAEALRMVCTETTCTTDPAQDLSKAIRLRHDGPPLLNILSGLTHGAPKLTGIPSALHHAARGENTALDAIIAAQKHRRAQPAEVFSQGLKAATVCADWTWPWGNAHTPCPAGPRRPQKRSSCG